MSAHRQPLAPRLTLTDLDSGQRWSLERRSTTLGSAASCAIRLSAEHAAPRHALIERQARGYTLLDYGAGPRLLLNGGPIRRQPLACGDVISIGGTRLLITSNAPVHECMRRSPHCAAEARGGDAEQRDPEHAPAQLQPLGTEPDGEPDSEPDEEMLAYGMPCVLVQVSWCGEPMRAVQVRRGECFVLGEDADADLALPAALLGGKRLELVNRRGEVTLMQAGRTTAPQPLLPGHDLTLRCGDLTIVAKSILAPPRLRRSRWRALMRGPIPVILAAGLSMVALPQAMAQWPVPSKPTEPNAAQYAFMRARLPAAEAPPPPPRETLDTPPPAKLAARGEQGQRPSTSTTRRKTPRPQIQQVQPNGRAVLPQTNAANESIETLEEAARYGLVALLQDGPSDSAASSWTAAPASGSIDWLAPETGLEALRGLGLNDTGSGGGGKSTLIPLGGTFRIITPPQPIYNGSYRPGGYHPYGYGYGYGRRRHRHPRVEISVGKVTPPMTKEMARKSLIARKNDLYGCPDIQGMKKSRNPIVVTVNLKVQPDGFISGASALSSTSAPRLISCVRRVVTGLIFPEQEIPLTNSITYEIRFLHFRH